MNPNLAFSNAKFGFKMVENGLKVLVKKRF